MGFLSTKSIGRFFRGVGRTLGKVTSKIGDLAKKGVKSIGEAIRDPRKIPKKIGELARTVAEPIKTGGQWIEQITGLPVASIAEKASGVISSVGKGADAIDKVIGG